MPKFSIITPTIGRTTLAKTVESIDQQNFADLEHIIMYDGAEDDTFHGLYKAYESEKRHVHALGRKAGDFGNSARKIGGDRSCGEWLTYIDDDDIYINDTFTVLEEYLNESTALIPDSPEVRIGEKDVAFIVFPCLRFGSRFFNIPPASCMTVSCQYIHRRSHHGDEIRFSVVEDGLEHTGYCADGAWIEWATKKYGFLACNSVCLSRVDLASTGQML